jgi:hypothetical protein
MVPDIEMLPTSYATLEEERHRVAVAIQSLPPQSFVFKPAIGTSVTLGQTETIELIECRPHEVRGLVRRLCATTGINMLKSEVDDAINARWLGIQRALGPTILRPLAAKSVLEETGFDEDDDLREDPMSRPEDWFQY